MNDLSPDLAASQFNKLKANQQMSNEHRGSSGFQQIMWTCITIVVKLFEMTTRDCYHLFASARPSLPNQLGSSIKNLALSLGEAHWQKIEFGNLDQDGGGVTTKIIKLSWSWQTIRKEEKSLQQQNSQIQNIEMVKKTW